jgi:hypothetical protein
MPSTSAQGRRREICVAVDGFGLHVGINQAALRLAALGHVQAIGCMVGGAGWPAWSRLLRRLALSDVDLGLHLDLTEAPLLPGTARPIGKWIRDAVLHQLDRRALREEIKAQLDAFEEAVGHGPVYVDGHQHVHQLPIVRNELLAELDDRYGWFRPWLRSTRGARSLGFVQDPVCGDVFKHWYIERLGARGLASAAWRMGYRQNQGLLGVCDFRGGAPRYRQLLEAWLRTAHHGDLLVCHPSLPTHASDPIIDARKAQFEVLSAPEFAMQLGEAGIDMRRMSAILGCRSSDAFDSRPLFGR